MEGAQIAWVQLLVRQVKLVMKNANTVSRFSRQQMEIAPIVFLLTHNTESTPTAVSLQLSICYIVIFRGSAP